MKMTPYRKAIDKAATRWFMAFLLLLGIFIWMNQPPKFKQRESKSLITIDLREVN